MKSFLFLIVCLCPGLGFAQTLTGSADIGAVEAAGSSSLANGVYTVRGSGADIWGTQDEFRYVYVPLNGDGEITARVDSLAAATAWTKAGVMIRETLNPSSRFAMTMLTGSSGADFQYRQTVAGSAESAQPDRATRAPYWVRVRRVGNLFTGYISLDGATWTQRGSITIQMNTSAFVGLAVTSQKDGTLVTTAFSNVRVGSVQSTPPPTTTTPTTPTTTPPTTTTPTTTTSTTLTGSADIGAVAPAGSSSSTNGVYTVRGSGADIWNMQDAFRYVYTSLSGDGEITARVDSLVAADSWTKVGVMIRETLSPDSKFAMTMVSGGRGSGFQYRLATAGWTDWTPGDAAEGAPYWVRVRRTGNQFTSYTSANGTSWAQRGSVTIPMGASTFVGLAVTSRSVGALATATFSNVSVGGVQSTPPTTTTPTTPPPTTTTPTTTPPTTTTPTTTPPTTTTPTTPTTTPPTTTTPTTTTSTTLTGSADIGAVAPAGSSSSTNGVYTVRGSGADIWNMQDAFRYVYTSLSGDGEITARVDSLVAADSWTKVGVMIRETLSPDSKFAMTMVSGGRGSGFQYRLATAGWTDWTPGDAAEGAPYWVRVRRTGNQFTSYTSANGTSWAQRGSVTIPMGASTFVGLAVTSRSVGALATATFSNVSVGGVQSTPPTTPPPTTPPVVTGSAALSWVAPTENSNGTPLTDLTGFKVYWGTAPGVYTNQLVINNPTTRTWTVPNLAGGRWYFAVTALAASGMESAKSNEATKLIQ